MKLIPFFDENESTYKRPLQAQNEKLPVNLKLTSSLVNLYNMFLRMLKMVFVTTDILVHTRNLLPKQREKLGSYFMVGKENKMEAVYRSTKDSR